LERVAAKRAPPKINSPPLTPSDEPPKEPFCFASWDGDPVLWKRGEAWMRPDFGASPWRPVNSAIAGHNARVLSKAQFEAKFPSLPPLHTADPPASKQPVADTSIRDSLGAYILAATLTDLREVLVAGVLLWAGWQLLAG
jgi:hypothetical protein